MDEKIIARSVLAGLSPEYAQHRLDSLLEGYFRNMEARESVYRAAIDNAPLEDRPHLHATLSSLNECTRAFDAGDTDAVKRLNDEHNNTPIYPKLWVTKVWVDVYFADDSERLKEALKCVKTVDESKRREPNKT